MLHIILTHTQAQGQEKYISIKNATGHVVAQSVEACAASRKVAGSISDGIIGIFR